MRRPGDLPAQAFAACFFLTMILLATPVVVFLLLAEGWRGLSYHWHCNSQRRMNDEIPRR